tara:strand:+ start:4097 stop:5056 length:960 start_codon:yes stop_codon:yes gene_type:complete
MNYQEIVNRIQSITNQHKMLADFGYGDLSDLKVRFENTSGDDAVQADYPYLFLNPGVHQRNQGLVTYNFNMIVMDMARGEVSDEPYNNMLAIQSQCQQYIDDVLAYLYFGYTDQPEVIYSGVTYSPFNERFADDVSGMTATLTIQVPQPIDNCITPFNPILPPVICAQTLPQVLDNTNNNPYYLGPDKPQSSRFLRWETQTQTDPAIGFWNDVILSTYVAGEYEFKIEQSISFNEPAGSEVILSKPVLSAVGVDYQPVCDSGNWPTTWTSTDPITYIATYRATIPANNTSTVIQFKPGAVPQSDITQLVGGTLKIGYQA